ncbi:MAG: hypothetical protein ACE5G9_14080, partial [Nitrospinales bacterium]
RSRISLRVTAETAAGPVVVERQFLGDAVRGEKRPVRINHVVWKFERGDRWIRDRLGAVSVSFDPYEFLNLSDGKKRQWILSHSPESRMLSRDNVYAAVVARVMERFFGSGLVRSLFSGKKISADLLSCPSLPKSDLMDAFRRQDAARCRQVKAVMDRAFAPWDESLTAEANLDVILLCLRSESQRLQTLIKESSAGAEPGVSGEAASRAAEEVLASAPNPDAQIRAARDNLRALDETLQTLRGQMQSQADVLARKNEIQRRIRLLRETTAGLTKEFSDDAVDRYRREILDLREQFADSASLCEEVDALNRELQDLTEVYQKRENLFHALSGELALKRRQLAAVESAGFQCPLAGEIRCDTDMEPYRDLLAERVEGLRNREQCQHERLAEITREIDARGRRVKEKQTELKKILRFNESLQKEIHHREERIFDREKNEAETRGRLKIHARELESLIAEEHSLDTAGFEDEKVLETRMRALEEDKQEQTRLLTQWLREQGKQEARRESIEQKNVRRQELETVKLLMRLLGPGGVQGELAQRVSQALEDEVNACLKLIDADYDFAMDLSGKKFSMGWSRAGKLIPLTTINSAHFILFSVSFLAAVINRLARVREKAGLPTLRALCIEAESMTPENLSRLLKGLSAIQERGLLDNVLVAHYHTVGEPEKLFGFTEHILREDHAGPGGDRWDGGAVINPQAAAAA